MGQIILAVDDKGNFLEYIPKEVGHQGEGRRHLAITVLLINSQGQVLLQRRKHQIFNNIWDFTGATHPLHKTSCCHSERLAKNLPRSGKIATPPSHFIREAGRNDRECDETLEEATLRCLEVEYGISPTSPRLRGVKNLGFFNYFSKDGENSENEHCAMMVGEYDGEVSLDPKVGYEYKWMDKEKFLEDAVNNPQNYAPWVIEGVKILKQAKLL